MEIATVYQCLRDWVEDLAADGYSIRIAASLDDPESDALAVCATALTISADPLRLSTRNHRAPSRRPLARIQYLVSVSGLDGGLEAQQVLLELVRRASTAPGFSVASETPSPSWWMACGVRPRPAFLLDASISESVKPAVAPLAREHQITLSSMTRVHGRVIASNGTPLAHAEVQISSSGQHARCDDNGDFHIHMHAADPDSSLGWVRVRTHGIESKFRIPTNATEDQPWLLCMEQL